MKRKEPVSDQELSARRELVSILDQLSTAEQYRVIRWMQKMWLKEKSEDYDA